MVLGVGENYKNRPLQVSWTEYWPQQSLNNNRNQTSLFGSYTILANSLASQLGRLSETRRVEAVSFHFYGIIIFLLNHLFSYGEF